ncbi:MAG: sigma-70 family RNA polymerase sigma factor [Anaerolineaceae bacterium]|jgi:RNA polymerase sigma-70 factor (ECF subfamily)
MKKTVPMAEPEALNEDNAVVRASQGDSDAFSLLYELNVNRIYNYVFYRVGSEADAEDITSRVFYRAFGHISNYVEKGVPFSAWLYRIAHNLIANWHRDNFRRNEVSLDERVDLPQRIEPPERSLEQTQEIEMLLRGIRALSDDRQQLLVLKFTEHLSNAEIAMIMKRSEGAIKSLYHRSLVALKEEMVKIGFEEVVDEGSQVGK